MFRVKAFTFSPVQENTYLLYNGQNNCIVIDPGCYFEEEKQALQNFIEKSHLRPQMLLNTHCHLDHVFGNKFVSERWNLELHIHEREKTMLEYAPASGLMWDMPFENYSGPLNILKEGEKISMETDELEILFTPGHSPGHVCFYCRKQGFIISGDVLFRMSIGRTDLPGGDYGTLVSSIREKLFVLPDDTIVYPGHGEQTTIGFEKQHNPFLNGSYA